MTADRSQQITDEKRIDMLQDASDLLDDGRPEVAEGILQRLGLPTDSMADTISSELHSLRGAEEPDTSISPCLSKRSPSFPGVSRGSASEIREDYLSDLSRRFPGLSKMLLQAIDEIAVRDEEGRVTPVAEKMFVYSKGVTVVGVHQDTDSDGVPFIVELSISKSFRSSRSFRDLTDDTNYYRAFGVDLSFFDPHFNEAQGDFFFSPRVDFETLQHCEEEVPAPRTCRELITNEIWNAIRKESEFQDDTGAFSPECLFPDYDRVMRTAAMTGEGLAKLFDGHGVPLAFAEGAKETWRRVVEKISPARILIALSKSDFEDELREGFNESGGISTFSGFHRWDPSARVSFSGFRGKS